jgi:hypothetical protein
MVSGKTGVRPMQKLIKLAFKKGAEGTQKKLDGVGAKKVVSFTPN